VGEPVTAWEGVTFGKAGGAKAGRVVEIQLYKKGLTGDVPVALGALTALKVLDLGGNQLTRVPAELGGLTALTVLGLGGNQLTSVPAELGGLTTLMFLNLSGNRPTSVPVELGGLTALTVLRLSENQLMSMPAEWKRGGALQMSGCSIYR
jgi:leucine-rich repeat protein SHOC2